VIIATVRVSVCQWGVEDLGGCPPAEDLAGPVVEAVFNIGEIDRAVGA
jgi:hypothetical protein